MNPSAEPRGRPTMRDVAALSRTSIKTVSRVVNREAGVSPELVERVLNAARALNYQPNLTASSLRRTDRKTRTIGLLVENVANPFSSTLHRAIEQVARARDVIVFAGSLDEDADRERELAMALVSRQVDGLIIVPTGTDQSYLLDVSRNGTPLVFADRRPGFFDADCVLTDNTNGARQGVAHLIGRGHRAIAYLGDLRAIPTAQERFSGYQQALSEHAITLEQRYVRHDLHTSDQAQAALAEVLSQPAPPTAVFASQNLVTIGALRAIRDLGAANHIALVGFDELPMRDLIQPSVTLVVQDVTEMGARAAELLFQRLDGDDQPSQTVVLPAHLVAGDTGNIKGPYAE